MRLLGQVGVRAPHFYRDHWLLVLLPQVADPASIGLKCPFAEVAAKF
jgi:hypothetical protein